MSDNEKSYRIKKKLFSDTFEVPRKLIAKLSEAGQHELKIFLALAALEDTEDYYTEEVLFAQVSEFMTESEFSEGLAFLRGAGLIEKPSGAKKVKERKEVKPEKEEKATPRSAPHRTGYTSGFLAEEASKGEFCELVNYAMRRLGKSFNTSDVATLFSFKDELLLPYDVVMLGIEHCASEGKPSLRYIEKFLISLADQGITDYESAEAYIKRRKLYLSFEGKIRALAGIDKRTLTPREKTFISAWQEMDFPWDMIKLAYDKTVDNTKEFSMRYMNKILENWKNAGFRTVDEVELGDNKPESMEKDSFNLDDFFKAAVERNQ